MYSLKSYSFERDEFITTNGIKVKIKDIQAIVLNSDEFSIIGEFKNPKVETEELKVQEVKKTTINKPTKKSSWCWLPNVVDILLIAW